MLLGSSKHKRELSIHKDISEKQISEALCYKAVPKCLHIVEKKVFKKQL